MVLLYSEIFGGLRTEPKKIFDIKNFNSRCAYLLSNSKNGSAATEYILIIIPIGLEFSMLV